VGEIFTNFNLFIYGGVNFEPYRAKFENLIGRKEIAMSEGFFYQILRRKRNVVVVEWHIL
jgi:hypothetical protein